MCRGGVGRVASLVRDLVVAYAVARNLAANPVGLSILDARGVTLYTDAQIKAHVERALVRQPQLFGEFINPNPFGQLLLQPSHDEKIYKLDILVPGEVIKCVRAQCCDTRA